jgi:hypothetical protein
MPKGRGSVQAKLERSFRRELRKLVGKKMWGFVGGTPCGSRFTAEFGAKLPGYVPVKNPNLSRLQQTHEGELGLFVECAWRIDRRKRAVCGCWSDNTKSGPMRRGLRQLVGKKVSRVLIGEGIPDLELEFSHGLVMRIFCDQTNTYDNTANYSLRNRERVFVVGCMGVLHLEERWKGLAASKAK